MNPSGRSTQPFGFSNQSQSQRMTSSNRFHPYTTSAAPAQTFGGRLPLTSPASPYNSLHAPAASAQNGALQRFNMPVGNTMTTYQNPHPDPALPRSAGYSRPASYNNQNTMSGRAGPTPMGMSRPNHVGVSQDRAFPSQLWQQALPLPSASQMMPCAGGDAFSPVSPVTSPNNQGKARVIKGNPARSQGLRVLSGRVGKVKVHFFQLELLNWSPGEGVGCLGTALPCALQGAWHSCNGGRDCWWEQIQQQVEAV